MYIYNMYIITPGRAFMRSPRLLATNILKKNLFSSHLIEGVIRNHLTKMQSQEVSKNRGDLVGFPVSCRNASIIHNHLMSFLSDNKLSCDNQHGFRPMTSLMCNSDAPACPYKGLRFLEERGSVDSIFLAFAKAFH